MRTIEIKCVTMRSIILVLTNSGRTRKERWKGRCSLSILHRKPIYSDPAILRFLLQPPYVLRLGRPQANLKSFLAKPWNCKYKIQAKSFANANKRNSIGNLTAKSEVAPLSICITIMVRLTWSWVRTRRGQRSDLNVFASASASSGPLHQSEWFSNIVPLVGWWVNTIWMRMQ